MASNHESAPLLSHRTSLADGDADSESLQAQGSIIHISDSNLPLRQQSSSTPPSNVAPEASLHPYVLFLCGLLCVVVDLAGGLRAVSEVRLFEVAICREYYKLHDPSKIGSPPLSYVDEGDCKLDDIQTDLAFLRAWKDISLMIPGLVLTVPFGWLADSWGRKPVLLLGLLGQELAYLWILLVCYFHELFPIQAIWASAAFTAVGGGNRTVMMVIYAVTVDVCPKNKWSAADYRLGAAGLLAELTSISAGSWLLSRHLWAPHVVAAPIILCGMLFLFFLPETLPKARAESPSHPSDAAATCCIFNGLNMLSKRLKTSIRDGFRDRNFLVCLLLTFLDKLTIDSPLRLFPQFASRRLSCTLAQAGYLLSINGFFSLVTLCSLPAITRFLEAYFARPTLDIDIWIMRCSLALLAAGNCVIGFSQQSIYLILGLTISAPSRSIPQTLQAVIASSASLQNNSGTAYSAAAWLDLAGGIVGGLTLAGLFKLGLHIGGEAAWGLGLPFWTSAILSLSELCLSAGFQLKRRDS